MTEKSIITIGLPKEEFVKMLAGLPDAQSLSDAFGLAAADLERKSKRGFIVNYFDLSSDVGYAPLQAGTFLSLDKRGTVKMDIPEDQFKELLTKLAETEGKHLSALFSEAAADLERKKKRSFVIKYFDKSSDIGFAKLPNKESWLSLKK